MVRIGVVGLDTTHSETLARNLAQMDSVELSAAWDGGAVRSRSYFEKFCQEYGMDQCDDLPEMRGTVDAVLVLTTNWDTHVSIAQPFLEAGIPTLIDKPLAGSVADIDRLETISNENDTLVFGGSGLTYHPSFQAMKTGAPDRLIHSVGYNDPFVYGPHLVDPIRAVVGADWTRVEPLPHCDRAVAVRFENESCATMAFDRTNDDATFSYLAATDESNVVRIDSMLPDGDENRRDQIYRSYLDAFLELVRTGGETPEHLFDAARLLVAAQAVIQNDRAVTPQDEPVENIHADGKSYVESYEPYY